jgi:ribosomal protein S26
MVKKVDSLGRSNYRKRGSKTKVQCQLCGKVVTKSGFIGHMHWKHGKDFKAPLLDKEKPMQYQVAKRKAKDMYGTIEWIVADLFTNGAASEANKLVKLRDKGVPREKFRDFVEKAVANMQKGRTLSFDKAVEELEKAVHAELSKQELSGHRVDGSRERID